MVGKGTGEIFLVQEASLRAFNAQMQPAVQHATGHAAQHQGLCTACPNFASEEHLQGICHRSVEMPAIPATASEFSDPAAGECLLTSMLEVSMPGQILFTDISAAWKYKQAPRNMQTNKQCRLVQFLKFPG